MVFSTLKACRYPTLKTSQSTDFFFSFTVSLPHTHATYPVYSILLGGTVICLSLKPYSGNFPMPFSPQTLISSQFLSIPFCSLLYLPCLFISMASAVLKVLVSSYLHYCHSTSPRQSTSALALTPTAQPACSLHSTSLIVLL